MTKVLFVHDGPLFYDDKGNYYEYSFHGLLERYSNLGDEITFLMRTAPLTQGTKNTLVPKEIRVVGVSNFKSPILYFKEKPKAEKIIEEEVKRADYLVLRGSSCSTIAIKYAKKYKKPYIYECVGCTWDSMWNYSLLGKAMAPFCFLNVKRLIKNAEYVHYVTNEFLQRRYPTNGKSIGCSDVEIETVDDCVLEKRMDKIEQMKQTKKIILGTAAAVDVRYKGQEYVIKALPELVKQGYDVEYHLAGGNRLNSTYLTDLSKKLGVENRVIYRGSLASNQMVEFYDSLDIYVQPSKQEGLPRSVIEAMSRGCIVIGSNIAGIPELLQKECLFRKGNSKDIEKVILEILKGNMSHIARENFEKAKQFEKMKLEENIRKFYDVFLEENPK